MTLMLLMLLLLPKSRRQFLVGYELASLFNLPNMTPIACFAVWVVRCGLHDRARAT
jgi:hypothetical protein